MVDWPFRTMIPDHGNGWVRIVTGCLQIAIRNYECVLRAQGLYSLIIIWGSINVGE